LVTTISSMPPMSWARPMDATVMMRRDESLNRRMTATSSRAPSAVPATTASGKTTKNGIPFSRWRTTAM
jgi:hypothetical protein